MVGNIGRLEGSGNGYRFYAEGYTPSLVTLLEALDAERLPSRRAYGARGPRRPRVAPEDVRARGRLRCARRFTA